MISSICQSSVTGSSELPRELILEIIGKGVMVWDKETCISVALVCRWWKQCVQEFRCERQSAVLLPGACFFPTDDEAHKNIFCGHSHGFRRFWEANPQLSNCVSHLNVTCLDFGAVGSCKNACVNSSPVSAPSVLPATSLQAS